MSDKNILVLNCGSSSIKFAVINIESKNPIISGMAEKLYTGNANLKLELSGNKSSEPLDKDSHDYALRKIVEALKNSRIDEKTLLGVGHRVVHGAKKFIDSTKINAETLTAIKDCSQLAPLHNPANIIGIELSQKIFPKLENIAVFDTAFHHTMPEKAYTYPLPIEWYEKYQVRRYGFHGTSHKYVIQKAVEILDDKSKSKIISLHLGNGCSAAAVSNGNCMDTTMGLTPLEGLVMGTRCGDIDPGIIGYIGNNLNIGVDEILTILNKKSGLLGISGISNDMRTLEEEHAKGNKGATLAIEVFCYKLAKNVGALSVPLHGVDVIVFTGGIGENSKLIRAKTIDYLLHLGFSVDVELNNDNGIKSNFAISGQDSKKILVIPTNEELMIANDTYKIIKGAE